MNYKIFIPCAGTGSRLGGLTNEINKGLVTVAGKPCLSHIIDKLPQEVEIVVALGYKADLVKQFLRHAYPDRKITIVSVSPYEGLGSGLGETLLQSREHLMCPFIFCANDTIVQGDLPTPDKNWMGYADKKNSDQYRGLLVGDYNQILDVCSKGAAQDAFPYIGLAGIFDYAKFWSEMVDGKLQGSIEIGESYALKQMLNVGIEAIRFKWYDTGSPNALEETRKTLESNSDHNILDKSDEAIWFVGNKVLKYSRDLKFITDRSARVEHLAGFVPEILSVSDNIYAYRYIAGAVFSRNVNPSRFSYLLGWLDGFWKEKSLDAVEQDRFRGACTIFYKTKTEQRVVEYLKRFEQLDSSDLINGDPTPKMSELLEQIDWCRLCDGKAVRFHGDLHFENILLDAEGTPPFVLLDWRQNFGGILEYGDVYYDFAKLLHGLIISHEMVKKNMFSISQCANEISYEIWRKHSLVECETVLSAYVVRKGFDWSKVRTLAALIFINIAPLHHYPYSKLLYYLGKHMLSRQLVVS